MTKTLSIITVTYNASNFLEETINSVIAQTFKDIEYIIVDGGSTDRTMDIVKKYQNFIDIIISEKDEGIYDAMNKGISLANGEYINFLNAGDTYCSESTIHDVFHSSGDVDMIYGNFRLIGENGAMLTERSGKPFTYRNLLRYQVGTLNHQSIFIKKRLCPMYDQRYKVKGELNWYFDLIQRGNNALSFCLIDYPVVNFRLGGYADRIFWKQIKELLIVMFRRAGIIGVIYALRNTIYSMIIHAGIFDSIIIKFRLKTSKAKI